MEWYKASLIHHQHAGKASRENTVGLAAGVLAPAVHEMVVVRTDEPGEGEKLFFLQELCQGFVPHMNYRRAFAFRCLCRNSSSSMLIRIAS
ncbi:hypothetical protein GCM10008014_47230 [Paenibacillus silvae]|uniref:Uncharacterized protein n=1 Tax=Paenibacillus silvae TaxID=1325358 RepID=A0ABQ1ZK25_9BACL|nr:hypothetical protein GCM10008014_47230 [Paenibacillus silvae]